MKVNEVMARVEDNEVIYLHLHYYGIIDYKNKITRDVRFVNENIGDWLVTNICTKIITPNKPVLEITAVKA